MLYPAELRARRVVIAALAALVTSAVAWADEPLRLPDGRALHPAGLAAVDADAAARWLTAGPIELPDSPGLDRHGRVSALPERAGVTLQASLVRAGRAVVAPEPAIADPVLAALLADEGEARAARRGVWSERRIGPFPVDRVEAEEGGFIVMEGTVVEVARARGFIYANFGADHRTDATLRMALTDADRWAKRGFDVMRLTGRNVRARGILVLLDGPMLEITHPAQIEVPAR